jgi:phosphoadenosine phosphosulfate reductase
VTAPRPEDAAELAAAWERLDADEVVARAVATFGADLALACSFQKEESVLVEMLAAATDTPRVFAIDTGALFDETLQTWRRFEERFGLRVEVADATDPTGAGWSPERCCGEAKVAALDRALDGLGAWITGIRREQGPTRADTPKLAYDAARGIWKLSPLADWTERDLWNRIHARDLPYHPLHDAGYASIGCAPCTRPGSGREGRWADSAKTECGLHVAPAGGLATAPGGARDTGAAGAGAAKTAAPTPASGPAER